VKIIIPARKGSKGVLFKNRKLLDYTLNIIPKHLRKEIIISTDDEEIIKKAKLEKLKVNIRDKKLSNDTASVREVLLDLISKENLQNEEIILMLYLTYPERKWSDIESALKYFYSHKCKSMLCKNSADINPFLCMIEQGHHGKQVIEHDLCRRQDYPKCFVVSHYIAIFKTSEIKKLNRNLYNESTYFYKTQEKLDIDEEKDMEKLSGKSNC